MRSTPAAAPWKCSIPQCRAGVPTNSRAIWLRKPSPSSIPSRNPPHPIRPAARWNGKRCRTAVNRADGPPGNSDKSKILYIKTFPVRIPIMSVGHSALPSVFSACRPPSTTPSTFNAISRPSRSNANIVPCVPSRSVLRQGSADAAIAAHLTRQLEELGRLDTRSAADFARQVADDRNNPVGKRNPRCATKGRRARRSCLCPCRQAGRNLDAA
jgi:hypothetical protein